MVTPQIMLIQIYLILFPLKNGSIFFHLKKKEIRFSCFLKAIFNNLNKRLDGILILARNELIIKKISNISKYILHLYP